MKMTCVSELPESGFSTAASLLMIMANQLQQAEGSRNSDT